MKSKWAVRGGWGAFVVSALVQSICGFSAPPASVQPSEEVFEVVWKGTGGEEQVIRTWYVDELQRWRPEQSTERDPADDQVVSWTGVPLNDLLEIAMRNLTMEQRADVDLIVLKNADGTQALIPRGFFRKYGVTLAWSRSGQKLSGAAFPFESVVPWTSKAAIRSEPLPVARYFVSGIRRVVLANYRKEYGNLFLKRRTDPMGIRGERLFVKTCMGCHGLKSPPNVQALSGRLMASESEDASSRLLSGFHAPIKGFPQIDAFDVKALKSYVRYRQTEGTGQVAGFAH